MSFKNEFTRYLDGRGIKYREMNENNVRISYSGDNTNDISVNVIFDEDGDGLVALRCWSFGKVPEDKRSKMLETCNDLNNNYRWVKFSIDKDNDIAVSLDAVIDIQTVGEECFQLVMRTVNIYDEAYPILMHALWS